MSIEEDLQNFPNIFQLIKVKRIDIVDAPNDLIEFWSKFGAGEIFETETIYSPEDNRDDDTIFAITNHFLKQGIPESYTVFHTGLAVSAYRPEDPKFVILDENYFNVISSFSSFEEWYDRILKKEYADRYFMKT